MEFDEKLEQRSKIWDPAFTAYFEDRILPDADRNGLWSVHSFGWTGNSERANFVSNQSEHVSI